MGKTRRSLLDDDPRWYRDAVIYETHVRSFLDSSGDGAGDFPGLTSRLDYLAGLGVTALWLLPFYPSPLRDDGYDIAQYFAVHPDYGTLADFKVFLREAHARGIRVITELVLNHTSDQHSWFQRARRARPGSPHRDFYVWSETPDRYADARIIFKDFESSNWSWDPVAKAYYWHRFYSHQPDLNFENPRVHEALLKVVDNWFGLGVDGLRLDAVPYLYEREGTNCENLPETHAFLRKLRSHVEARFPGRMLLAEANQWPEDAAAYFGAGDECHMAFHFPVMPRIFMALQMEDRFPVTDILEQTPHIPEGCQWGMFLRNHDELTLEMVTDEERDYMYRMYARDRRSRINLGIRRRLAPLVGNSRRKIELMNILLFSLPGTPVIYYGDEIGMGDNYYLGDRNGVRTPMQWSGDRSAGFSRANPQSLYLPVIIDPEYHFESVNVETQERNPSSLLWWMKRVIAMRKRHRAFSRGELGFPPTDNPKVLAFLRTLGEERVLVVINLSRFAQVAEIDLAGLAGLVPVELFSRNRFPTVRETPWILTLSPHGYFWFALEREEEAAPAGGERPLPELTAAASWTELLAGAGRQRFADEVLPPHLRRARWFGGKGRSVRQLRIEEVVPLDAGEGQPRLLFVEVAYSDGSPETYLLPLAWFEGERGAQVQAEHPEAVLARCTVAGRHGVIADALLDEGFRAALLALVAGRRRARGERGVLRGLPGRRFRRIAGERPEELASHPLRAEQSNSAVLYGSRVFLKTYRRPEPGPNPDVEISRFLTEVSSGAAAPPFAGTLEYERPGEEPVTLAHLQGFVPNLGDAWTYTLDVLRGYFERVLSAGPEARPPELPASLLDLGADSLPQAFQELVGPLHLDEAALLGRRTAELHRALATAGDDPVFAPEPFSLLYQRSVYQSMRDLARRVLQLVRRNLPRLPEELRGRAESLLGAEAAILGVFQRMLVGRFDAVKIRYHGDYHLGQVLRTGKDFLIIDFEGEPARALSERRLKRSPLRDVAGMVRSFHYAAHSALHAAGTHRPEDLGVLGEWAEAWYAAVSGVFLESYRAAADAAPFLPADRGQLETLLRCFLLDKAVYELAYELNNRPAWVFLPLAGIEKILAQR